MYTLRPHTHYRRFWAPWRGDPGSPAAQAERRSLDVAGESATAAVLAPGVAPAVSAGGGDHGERQGRVAVSALKALVARLIICSTHSVSYRQVRRVDASPELVLAVPAVGFASHLDATRNTADSPSKNPGNKPAPGSGAR